VQQRQCAVIQGEADWCRDAAQTLIADYEPARVIWLSNHSPDNVNSISVNKAQTLLGREFDAVVIDGLESINPDSIGAMVGTVIAGGAVIILVNDFSSSDLWLQRFCRVCQQFNSTSAEFHFISQSQHLAPLSLPNHHESRHFIKTEQQQQALAAILKVVHGHRRRPLVLTADRGRGKSAVLGMAAAQLLLQNKQTILVTAPSLASAETVFDYASRLLPEAHVSPGLITHHTAVIKFVAPDVLVEGDFIADLVLVDEAAAIPAAMLEQLLDKYSRLVFASTIHGYEGTGRGFAVRFQQTLTNKAPNWNHYQMTSPIRWRDDDLLEQFSFEALLLDASPVDDDVVAKALPEQCEFELVNRQQLIDDEIALRSLFGLMVLAHYRTRPSDLMMMLDRDDISVYVMRFQGHIIASAWCVQEGELAPELSQAIYAGERRLKGHLLPQSLLAHAGLVDAGTLSYQRIIRLAVHPALQGRGLGHAFVEHIASTAQQNNIDLIGASFASSIELIRFWSDSDFHVLRLGLHHDEVSGSHAMMMLKGLSPAGQQLVQYGQQRFSQHWPLLLQQQFHHLQPALVVTVSQLLPVAEQTLSQSELYEISAFALKQRGFEVCQIVLWQAMSLWIRQEKFLALSQQQQALCVMLVLQQRSFKQTAALLAYSGKAELITALRQAIATLLV